MQQSAPINPIQTEEEPAQTPTAPYIHFDSSQAAKSFLESLSVLSTDQNKQISACQLRIINKIDTTNNSFSAFSQISGTQWKEIGKKLQSNINTIRSMKESVDAIKNRLATIESRLAKHYPQLEKQIQAHQQQIQLQQSSDTENVTSNNIMQEDNESGSDDALINDNSSIDHQQKSKILTSNESN